jgi:hypothetical protein
MFTEKDILARLQNGEDAQAIADEFAKVINAANKTYTDQKVKEEAERKAAEEAAKKRDIQKEKELQSIIHSFYDWYATYYEDLGEEDIDAKQIIELIDSFQEMVDTFTKLGLSNIVPVEKKVRVSADKVAKKGSKINPDDAINAFLKQMGW